MGLWDLEAALLVVGVERACRTALENTGIRILVPEPFVGAVSISSGSSIPLLPILRGTLFKDPGAERPFGRVMPAVACGFSVDAALGMVSTVGMAQAGAAGDGQGPATEGIAFVSPLGGVGRTAVALGVAKALAAEGGQRALFVDLDPQGAASIALLGEEDWRRRKAEGRTLSRLFEGGVSSRGAVVFDAEAVLVRGLGGDGGAAGLDLLPSGCGDGASADEPVSHAILHDALTPVIGGYDYIILDCGSGFGAMTKNGLSCASGYVIPILPDMASEAGVLDLVSRIRDFSEETGWPIPPLGIARIQIAIGERLFPREVPRLFQGKAREADASQPSLFETVVRLDSGAPGDPGDGGLGASPGCVGKEAIESLRRLTSEIIGRCHDRQHGVGTRTVAGG